MARSAGRATMLFEAVWAGDVAEADFDRTDIVFGSGYVIPATPSPAKSAA